MKTDQIPIRSVPLFHVGSIVETDEGLGEIIDIVIQAGKYDRWELDPPKLVIMLENGSILNACMCSIRIPESEKATELLHREYDRLWPPVDVDGGYIYEEDDNTVIREGE